MDIVNEKTIKITSYEVAGKLPDPFVFDNGKRVKSIDDWQKRREEIYKTAVLLQYGTPPPAPEFVEVEGLHSMPKMAAFRVRTGTRKKPIVFVMRVFFPTEKKDKYPVVIDGDMCFPYPYDENYRAPMRDNGILYVGFDRTEVAHVDFYRYGIGEELVRVDGFFFGVGRFRVDVDRLAGGKERQRRDYQ